MTVEFTKEAVHLEELFNELGFEQPSAIHLATNLPFSSRTKHINVRDAYLVGLHDTKIVRLKKVLTDDNVGDMFTKSLPPTKFENCSNLIQLRLLVMAVANYCGITWRKARLDAMLIKIMPASKPTNDYHEHTRTPASPMVSGIQGQPTNPPLSQPSLCWTYSPTIVFDWSGRPSLRLDQPKDWSLNEFSIIDTSAFRST
ncbi:hypothetical protein OSB04_029396 [Centaurea solstitialis]|uniref:Uncharacterized protein n=1 Tax=Centaurea solstitialis TaxID=347529 RepID=A0AA38SV05_9ASTR|nr:hypothetical protein OSB04_029396 [Centaurea solstitialis]